MSVFSGKDFLLGPSVQNMRKINQLFTFLLLIVLVSCGKDDCDQNARLSIDFELKEIDGQFRLINKTSPACRVENVSWDFDGDGIEDSKDKSPLVIDTSLLGMITLKINNLNEISKRLSPSSIVSNDDVIVDYLVPSTGNVGEQISFTDYSTPEDAIQNREWDFGDGKKSNKQQPTHAYKNSGTYTFKLCINSNNCKEGTISIKKRKVPSYTPTPSVQKVDGVVTTTSTHSSGSGGSSNYKSGGTSTSSIVTPPIVTKPNSEPPLVTPAPQKLEPISDNSLKDVSIAWDIPFKGEIGDKLDFHDKSTFSGDVDEFVWTIGGERKVGKTVFHSFSKAGDYPIKLCLNEDPRYCKAGMLRVTEKPKYTVDFRMPSEITVGESITLKDASSSNVAINSYVWSIDGNTRKGKSTSYTFSTPKTYSVKLCVDGEENCKIKSITVKSKPKLPPPPKPAPVPTPKPTPKPVSTPEPRPKPAPTSKPAPAPAPVVVIPDVSSNVFIPEDDDDFSPRNTSNKIGGYNNCSNAEWVNQTTIKMQVIKKAQLNKATIYADNNGKVKFSMTYKNNGEETREAVYKTVNKGRSEVLLNNLYITLYPGVTYYFTLQPQGGLKIQNIASCSSASGGDGTLKMDTQGSFAVFDIQYRH